MFWAGIHDKTIKEPFRVKGGVKMNTLNYAEFFRANFQPWFHCLPLNEKKGLIIMQDNAPVT